MKTSKSPYEIRLELLQLSFDILSRNATIRVTDGAQLDQISTVDVINEARKLNDFVSQTTENKEQD